jgi:hypothetical protein
MPPLSLQQLYVRPAAGAIFTVTFSGSVPITGSITALGSQGTPVNQDASTNDLKVIVDSGLVTFTNTSIFVLQALASTNPFTISATTSANNFSNPIYVSSNISNATLAVTQSGTWTVAATQSGTWTVAATQSGTWNIGTVTTVTSITNTVSVQPVPATSGGLTIATGTIGATATQVKASAGQIYGWYIYNSNSTAVYMQIFNTSSVTLGTTTPVMSIGIPAGSGANILSSMGIAFSTAIYIAFTTTRSGSGAPANTVDYNIFYD